MSDTIQLRSGNRAQLPQLIQREPGWCADTSELFIGGGSGNVLVASAAAAGGIFTTVTAVTAEAGTVTADSVSAARYTITGQLDDGDAENGTLYESTDGSLKYKSLGGEVIVLGL
ncbi:MAG: hypothetical protein LBL09_00520 [Oscillospiraceae bacterium]|jgi:hypothetical protein|nr:hypothetical protein [Oscillospiraceae bacterium]